MYTIIDRPVTGLGHQEGEEFCERCPNFLNYVQNIFPRGAKNFLGGFAPPAPSWLRA